MGYNIVLIEPEIPMNTGNIGRLSLASGSTLHLVKPFGFELNDKRVKRAGLDYWKHISLKIYENVEEFFEQNKDKKMAFFSSHGGKQYWDIDFSDELFLVFGKESVGLSSEIIENNQENLYKIPIYSEHIRSLNLANAVSVVVYEGIRNLKFGS
jgi:tRNA (cytidine/uridine-2'-O-)-methyltransferase